MFTNDKYAGRIKSLQDEALAHTATARAIADAAKGRTMTAAEKADHDAALAKAKTNLETMRTLKADAQVYADAKALSDAVGSPTNDDGTARPGRAKGRVGLSGKDGRALAARMSEAMVPNGQKSLMPSGQAHASNALLPEVVELGHATNTLLDVLLAIEAPGPTFSQLVQRTRENNAAPVAEGEVKPTTVLGLEELPLKLEVIAHLSEPVPHYWFKDNVNLELFVQDELVRGLRDALEDQVLTGDGTSPDLHGILTTSGIQAQAFTTDVAATVRKAITKLEVAGHEDNHLIVLRPEDWEAAETARAKGSGQLEAVATVTDRAVRSLWGVPVVVSNALPIGTGLVLDREAVTIYTDGVVDVRWSETGDDFERNLVRARVESRYASAVTKPLGVVTVTTAATP